MKIMVKSDALQVLASTRAVFTSTKGSSPISRNARLTTEGNTLILRATNGAVSLYMRIGGAVGLVFVRQASNEGLLLTATDKNTIGSTIVKASVPPSRTFYSFYQAADEAALSCLYAGIHFMPALELGLMQGKCIGEKVNNLAWKK